MTVGGFAIASAAPAGAAVAPLTTDPAAEYPDIAVDENGTSHVVWNHKAGGDDFLVYCRVPRGASACAATKTFALPLESIGPQSHIALMPTGELVLTSERCCFASDRVYALTSTDGGATFSAPKILAEDFYGWGGEVEPGPGNFSLSLVGGGGGCNDGVVFSVAPLEATTSEQIDLSGGCFEGEFDASIGFTDPVSPMVAYGDWDTDTVFYRRWDGSGDYNDLANWTPVKTAAAGDEPKLAYGARGVFLIYQDNESPRDYFARRYDTATDKFIDEKMVSADDGSEAIFRDFFQDGGGSVHATFLERPEGTWQLRHAIMPPGQGWQKPKVLATDSPAAGGFVNLRIDAAPDGGGAIVADGQGQGTIYFAAFPPTGGAGACPPTVKLGIAVVRAIDGCFAKKKGGDRVATGPVKVNGVDISPLGAGATAAAAFKVTVNQKQRTLRTNAKALVEAAPVTLDKSKLGWKFPAGKGAVKRLGAADTTVFNNLAQHAKQLFEFPVKGDAELLIGAAETARIPVNFGLPGLIGGVSGAVDLNLGAGGWDPTGLTINAPSANIGLLKISNIKVTYSGQDRFTGSASLSLPPAYGGAFNVGFGFEDGRFNYLHYDQPFSPMLPIVAPPFVGPEPLIGLESLGIDYVNAEGSRKFIGSVDVAGGGKYFGLRAAALDGNVTLEFPASGPATLSAGGDLSVVSIPFATGKVAFSTDGLFTFNGSFEFPPGFAVIDGSVSGWVSVAPPIRFSAYGGVNVFGKGGEGVISSKGITACADVNPDPTGLTPEVKSGVSYGWGDTFPAFTCEVDSFKLAKPSGSREASAEAANATAVRVEGGLPQVALEIAGAGGAPRGTVTTPNGETVTSGDGPIFQGRFAAIEYPAAGKTYVTIGEPPAGAYGIETAAGSVEISGVQVARGLPALKVSGRVSGKGAKRTLRYSYRKIAGQKVTFAEQSASGLYREITSPKKAKGTITFRPRNSHARKRRIIGLVEQRGLPRARVPLGKFTAPKYRLAAKPRKLRVRRKGRKLVAGWKKVGGARGYKVLVALPKDGRRILRYLNAKQTKLSLGRLEANDRGTIAVRAIGADAQPGKAAKAKLKPQKRKKKRR